MSPTAITLLIKGLDILVPGRGRRRRRRLTMAPAVREAFSDVTAGVRLMIEEDNRDPTPEEWATLDKLRDNAAEGDR